MKTGPKPLPLIERFNRLHKVSEGGCWSWIGQLSVLGYSRFYIKKGAAAVAGHRWAYMHFVGAIPEGLELDHLCRNRACVNPAHLEPVTHRENVLRGDLPAAKAYRAGTCTRGHVRTPENTYPMPRGVGCRVCRGERARARAKERRATDPDYAERCRAYCRRWYHKQRSEGVK